MPGKKKYRNKKGMGPGYAGMISGSGNGENPLEFWQRQKRIEDNNTQINKLWEKYQEEKDVNNAQESAIGANKKELDRIWKQLEWATRDAPPEKKPGVLNRFLTVGRTALRVGRRIKPATRLLHAFPTLGDRQYVGAILKGARAIGFGNKKSNLKMGNKKFKSQKSKMEYVRSFK